MKRGEKGYTFIELIVALGIIVLVGGAAAMTTFQVFRGIDHNNAHNLVVRQVQNGGYWIGRDAQTALSVSADNLTAPDFLVLAWTIWDDDGEPTYHTATYYFEGLNDGVGTLKRRHWSSDGASQQTLIAQHIYYDPADPSRTSRVSYVTPSLTLQLTALFEQNIETREYIVTHRPNL